MTRPLSTIGKIQYRILLALGRDGSHQCDGSAYAGRSKLRVLLGDDLLPQIPGKTVIDFGCGEGTEAIELAKAGAKQVLGLDVRQDVLAAARQNALAAGFSEICRFSTVASTSADIIVSLDSFEHFSQPAQVLQEMGELLRPGGEIFISFGPTWYHPLGGHLFSIFPWAHLVFSEAALIRWRSDFKTDGATKFGEVAGGLNQMTIGRFESLVKESELNFSSFELIPIRGLKRFHNRFTREFATAIVRCRLVKK